MIWMEKAAGIVYELGFGMQCAFDVEVLLGVLYPSCAITGILGRMGSPIRRGVTLSVLSNFQKEALEEMRCALLQQRVDAMDIYTCAIKDLSQGEGIEMWFSLPAGVSFLHTVKLLW